MNNLFEATEGIQKADDRNMNLCNLIVVADIYTKYLIVLPPFINYK